MLLCDCCPGWKRMHGKVRLNGGSVVRRVPDGGVTSAFAGNDTTENGGCGVGGAVNGGAVESECVEDIVQGLGGGESSEGLFTTFVMGSSRELPCLKAYKLWLTLCIWIDRVLWQW